MVVGALVACLALVARAERASPTSPTRRPSPNASRRSCGSSSSPRSAGPASRTSRWTSTCSSTSRRWRCAGRGTPPTSSRSGRRAADLVGLYEYHLDFPGDALDPGCTYERWARRLTAGSAPAVYAHVATEPGTPGKLALQYWLFYAFNDFNNLHEGDWEMIQLVFDAGDAREALAQEPVYGRLQLARRRRAGRLGRRQARARRRDASGRLSGRRLAREQVHRRPLPRQLGRGRRRLRRHPRPAPRASPGREDDPERRRCGARGVPVDRVRGALGRAPAGLLQRPHWAEPEDRSGPSRSTGRRAGATGATPSRRRGCSARARPTSSAPASRGARGG